MKIDNYSNAHIAVPASGQTGQDRAEIQMRQAEAARQAARQARSEEAPIASRVSSKQIMQDSAEYYYKTGKIYENLRSYRQALSAYERANIVQPSVSVAQSVMSLRSKMY